MKKDVIIVGGGCIGLMSAYCLQKSGRSVTVIEKNDITNGTSFGNAGLLSAFKKAPLSAPGAITDTIKLMLKGESPASVHPTFNLHLYKWLLKFAASSTEARLRRTLALFERYGQISLDMYEAMVEDEGMDFHFRKDGLLMIYTEQQTFDAKAAHCTDPDAYEILSKEKTKEYMPILNDKVIGSILLKENGHIDPGEMMLELKKYLEAKGVEFLLNEEVDRLEFEGSKVSKIRTSKGVYEAETFILSTGADDKLARQAKNKFMMTPAKGYSLTFKMNEELMPKTTSLFADLFIAMTPRKETLRMTSKLVPFMAALYIGMALIVLISHYDQIGGAFEQIFVGAFTGAGVAGGFIGALIQGLKRATFSNEAGVGSAAIAHSAVKTKEPIEGIPPMITPATSTAKTIPVTQP